MSVYLYLYLHKIVRLYKRSVCALACVRGVDIVSLRSCVCIVKEKCNVSLFSHIHTYIKTRVKISGTEKVISQVNICLVNCLCRRRGNKRCMVAMHVMLRYCSEVFATCESVWWEYVFEDNVKKRLFFFFFFI